MQVAAQLGTTTNFNIAPINKIDFTFRNNTTCLNKAPDYSAFPSTVSAANDQNSRYGIFSTTGNLATTFNGQNPNGVWTLYFNDGTSTGSPCLTSASIVFGDITSTDQTTLGDNCVSAINWNGTPICAATNGKTSSSNMPGWQGPAASTFGTFQGGITCDWNAANNNDVWIKFTPTATNVCIAISGLVDNLQSVVVKDPNTDGDNNACTGASGGQYWQLVSCPRDNIFQQLQEQTETTTIVLQLFLGKPII